MKRMLIYMVVSLLMGALTACTGKPGLLHEYHGTTQNFYRPDFRALP